MVASSSIEAVRPKREVGHVEQLVVCQSSAGVTIAALQQGAMWSALVHSVFSAVVHFRVEQNVLYNRCGGEEGRKNSTGKHCRVVVCKVSHSADALYHLTEIVRRGKSAVLAPSCVVALLPWSSLIPGFASAIIC